MNILGQKQWDTCHDFADRYLEKSETEFPGREKNMEKLDFPKGLTYVKNSNTCNMAEA